MLVGLAIILLCENSPPANTSPCGHTRRQTKACVGTGIFSGRLLQFVVRWTACRALALLQQVLNVATLFVVNLRPRDHVTSVQRSLNWLPIRQRIQYKLCVLINGAAHRYEPDNISIWLH